MIEDVTYIANPAMRPATVPKYVGPYIVVRRTQNGPYVLRNTTYLALERHVPVNQMKVLFQAGARKPKVRPVPGEKSLDVEEILDNQNDGQDQEYLVKWKDYPVAEATWELVTMFDDYSIIERFWKKRMAEEAEANKTKKPGAVQHLFYTERQW